MVEQCRGIWKRALLLLQMISTDTSGRLAGELVLHTTQSLQALNHCNVLVEKPIALSVDDARSLIQKEKETGYQLFCVMQKIYLYLQNDSAL